MDYIQGYVVIISKERTLDVCVEDISARMGLSLFMLNQEKTELAIFKQTHQLKVSDDVGGKTGHITDHCTCRYSIRNTSGVKEYITTDVCRTLAHALETSRLDYDNALLWSPKYPDRSSAESTEFYSLTSDPHS